MRFVGELRSRVLYVCPAYRVSHVRFPERGVHSVHPLKRFPRQEAHDLAQALLN